jgi:hypothetical protein
MEPSAPDNPYKPPGVVVAPDTAVATGGRLPRLDVRARVLRGLLLLHYPYFAAYVVVRVLWLTDVSDFGQTGSASVNTLPWRVFTGFTSVLGLSTSIFFLWWMHGAYIRATRGVAYTRFTPRFSIVCWFIPLADFVLPLLAMRHLWQLSRRGADWREERPPPYINVWWCAWMGGTIVNLGALAVIAIQYGPGFSKSPELHAPRYLAFVLLSALLSTAALVLVRRLVREITAAQRERLGVD